MPDKQDFEKARNKSVLFFTAEGSISRNGLMVDEHILVFTGGAATSPTGALQIFKKEREDKEVRPMPLGFKAHVAATSFHAQTGSPPVGSQHRDRTSAASDVCFRDAQWLLHPGESAPEKPPPATATPHGVQMASPPVPAPVASWSQGAASTRLETATEADEPDLTHDDAGGTFIDGWAIPRIQWLTPPDVELFGHGDTMSEVRAIMRTHT